MKYYFLLLLTAVLCASAHAQYTYEWDTCAYLSARGLYCQSQKTKTADEVPVSCDKFVSAKLLDSMLANPVYAYDSNLALVQLFSERLSAPDYTITHIDTKKVYAATVFLSVHQFAYQPAHAGPGYHILYHSGFGILAKRLNSNDGVLHPWCFLDNKRVLASTRYFILQCLLKELKKVGV